MVIGNRLASILSSHLGSLAWYDLKVGAWARPNEAERERFSPSHGMFSLRERAPERWNGNQGGAFFYNSFYSFAAIRSNLNLGLSCVSSPAVASQKLTIKALLHSRIPRVQRFSFFTSLPCPLNTTLYENLETCLTTLMSDIEKLENPQRRCQVGNPAPLYVAFHWHGYWQN